VIKKDIKGKVERREELAFEKSSRKKKQRRRGIRIESARKKSACKLIGERGNGVGEVKCKPPGGVICRRGDFNDRNDRKVIRLSWFTAPGWGMMVGAKNPHEDAGGSE